MSANPLAHDIYCIDVEYLRPKLACSYLIVDAGKAAFIDCGTSHSVPLLLEALNQCQLRAEDVEFVIPTHVHLDHAGGAGALMQALPNATAVIHPKGARHLIDPTRLIESTKSVYGEEKFADLYGEIIPIDADRVFIPDDNTSLRLNQRELFILYTPGHARHHFCVFDTLSKGWFTGDTFGISYPDIQCTSEHYLLPTTTPTQFEPDAWEATIQRLLSKQPESMYLTHYGQIKGIDELAKKLITDLKNYVKIALAHADQENRIDSICAALKKYTLEDLQKYGYTQPDSIALELLNNDLHLNSQGLDVWLSRQKLN